MATAPQIHANQMNAQKSTGPVTAQGKEIASRNATTHGLTSNKIKAAETVTFEQFLNDFTHTFQPQTDLERALVRRCAEYQVRIDRGMAAEAALMNDCINSLMDEDSGLSYEDALGRVFSDKQCTSRIGLVMRYQAQATRAYRQTRKELEQTIAARRAAEAEQPVASPAAVKVESTPVTTNGSVSQNTPPPAPKPVIKLDGAPSYTKLRAMQLGR